MDWRRIPSLSALRAFEAQARLGGFTAAARELNITQAAVAQHVRRLEDFFSCALVQRQGRSMGLTDKGRGGRLLNETIETDLADFMDRAGRKVLKNDDKLDEEIRKVVRQIAMEEIGKKPEVTVVVSRLVAE